MPAAAADPTKREISGFFLSQEKFGSHCDSLASPACGTVSLRLFHNEPQHTAAVLQALRDNTSVTSLDIFELDPASASTLGSLLASNPRLTSLAIHHAHGFEAATRLAAGLAANTGLTQLHFSQLDARGVTAIANAVAAWASAPHGARLQHLRLDKSLLNAEAAAALAAALGPQAAALARLAVVESDMGGEAAAALLGSPGWAALTAALTELDLSSCHLGPQAGELLGRFLAAPGCRLAALALSNNRLLGPGGATALAAGLAANASLRRLDLANCGVTAPGVVALAAALRPEAPGGAGSLAAPPLQQLCLNDNAAGAEGLLALLCAMSPFPLPRPKPAQHVEGLLPPCGLRTLQLDSNQIRGIDLAEAMGVAAPPKILSPAAAAVHQLAATLAAAAREARAAAMAAATANGSEVEEAPSARRLVYVTGPLEQVSLAGNALYDAGTTALAAALGGAPSLESLDLRENGISDAGVAALLPLVGGGAGADGRRMLGGASRRGSAGGAGSGSSSVGLQGLVLDGNRIHNSGGQALLEAVTAAPGLWRFSAEANKLTDPALRLSLTQLSQLRAARRSQLLVLGRQYSSSSSSSGEDPEGQGQNGRRGSGGGGGGADSGRRSDGGGDSHRNSMEEEDRPPSQQHQQQPQNGGGGGNVAGAAMDLDGPQDNDGHFRHHHHQHKHRLDEGRAGGGNSSGDDDERSGERRPSAGGRNVAARAGLNGGPHDIHVSAGSQAAAAAAAMLNATAAAADGPAWRRAGPATMDVASSCNGNGCSDAALTGGVRRGLHAMAVGAPCGGGGGGLGGGCGGAHPMAIDSQPCMPSSAGCGGGGGRPPSVGGASSHDSLFGSYDPPSHLLEAHGFRGGAMAVGTPSRHAPAGAAGARFGGSSSGGVAGGGGGGTMATSPPPAMCYATAMTGVGGAGSVGVSKQAGGGRGGGGGGGGASGHDFKSTPQQILPACRRPRYKPLTPEQQRMFEDF